MNDKLRIGIICYPSIGGSGLVATELGKELAGLGHEVHFISYSVPFKLSAYHSNIFFHSVDPINYPLFNQTLYTFSLTAKIVDVVTEYDLDIIHAHYSIPHSLCAHLAREVCSKDIKIITTLHGTDVTLFGRNEPLFSLNKYSIEKSDRVTTVSQYQKDHTIREFNIVQDIDVIHNFVDTETFKPNGCGNRSCLAARDEKIIMHVSNFRTVKNPQGVIKTFYRVLQQKVKARLVLVGDGPGIGEIKGLCKHYGICDSVSFLGKLDDVETVLSLADCVFQPSFLESFGMVLLEAMACAVPTVSSNVDGIPEVVVEGKSGYMAAPEDVDTLAERIVKICESDTLAAELGAFGRARAIECFSPGEMVGRYVRCYENVLG